MKNRPYSRICTTVLVLVGISIALTGSVAAQSTGYVDVAASDLSGSGTGVDPYVITNASELQAMEDDLTASYVLGNDINANGTSEWRGGDGFAPIGGFSSSKDPFEGTFSGNNNTVSGLVINRPDTTYIGLFGFIEDGTIKNAHLENISISGDENSGIGGLAGVARNAIVTNVSVNGSINSDATELESAAGGLIGDKSGGITRNSSSSATIDQNAPAAGGLVGRHRNDGTITTSFATGDVNAARNVGGLVGDNGDGSTISKSYASGDVTADERLTGGLVGANTGVIRNSYALGSVSSVKTVGGLVGSNVGEGIISSSYAAGSVNADSLTGGLAGVNRGVTNSSYWDKDTTGQTESDGNATGLNTVEMTDSAAQTNMAGFEFGTVWKTQPNEYPTLIETNELNKPQVKLSDVQLKPATVGLQAKHNLTFTVSGVSADNQTDNISINIPDSVTVVSVDEARSPDTPYDVTIENEGNPIELSTNPDEPTDTVEMEVEVTVELSANNLQ